MARFIAAEKRNYTQTAVYHLTDRETACNTKAKTKGLLTQMLTFPEDWKYSEMGLTAINNKDGRTSVRTCIKELTENGYLERNQEIKGNKFGKIIYTLYEKPKHLMEDVQSCKRECSEIFKTERVSGYSFLSNYHLKDKELSLSAKGILSQMLVLPESYHINIRSLAKLNSDGESKISKAIKELIERGYIVNSGRERRIDGTLGETLYIVYEKPVPEITENIKDNSDEANGNSSDSSNEANENSLDNSDEADENSLPEQEIAENKNSKLRSSTISYRRIKSKKSPRHNKTVLNTNNGENFSASQKPTAQIPTTQIPTTQKPTAQNEHNKVLIELSIDELNKKILNTSVLNICESSYPSNQSNQQPYSDYDGLSGYYKKTSEPESYKLSLEEIKDYFDYNFICRKRHIMDYDVDAVFDILYETLNNTSKYIKILGDTKHPEVIKSKLMKLTSDDIADAIRIFKNQTVKIGNPSGYMLSILYNIKQNSLKTTNEIQHELSRKYTEYTEQYSDLY